jgi:resuscitation-promoting factor RpfB
VVAVLAALSLVAYPTITGRDGAATGPASPTVPPEAGLQLLGRQGDLHDPAQQRQEVLGTSTTVAPTDTTTPTATSASTLGEAGSTSSAARTSAPARTAATVGSSGTPSASVATTPPASSRTTPSASTTAPGSTTTASDSTRTATRAMLAEFGFADSEFGCLNALWNRLGLWGTVAQARSGLAYIKSRYGSPCAAWDHVKGGGGY